MFPPSPHSSGELFEVDIFPARFNPTQNQIEDAYLEQQRFDRCPKKQHDKFFLVKDLTLADLTTAGVADSARCQTTLDLIRLQAVQTVKLVVTYTAKYRPDKFGAKTLRGLGGPYYFRTGTGYVYLHRSRAYTPPGFNPGTIFHVSTACHVIYNNEEAEKTSVWFFFYNDEDHSGVIKARGLKLVNSDEEGDTSTLWCVVDHIQTAREVWRKLDEAEDKLKRLTFPSSYNISYCISCPHGTAFRVSFGSLNVVKEGNTDLPEMNRYKWFYSRIPTHCGIQEKKVLYSWWRENLKLDPKTQNVRHPQRERVTEILQHAEDKYLVMKPTDGEMIIMQEVWEDMWDYITAQSEQELISQGLSQSEIDFIYEHDDPQLNMLRKKIFRREARHVVMPHGWKQRYQILKDEIVWEYDRPCKGVDIEKINKMSTMYHLSDWTSIRTMTYSIPTCPGSSGSFIWSQVIENGQDIRYMATHCAGPSGGKPGNRSGPGVMAILCHKKENLREKLTGRFRKLLAKWKSN